MTPHPSTSQPQPHAVTGVDPDAVRAWLTARVALYLERSPADIDPAAKLVGYGLDSVYALTLCGDIEDEYGLEVDPTLAWDHPTVDAIVVVLVEKLAG
jgi:acyl carrier protein